MAIPKDIQSQVWDRDGGRCRYCLISQFGQAARFHIDHIHPKCAGGADDITNLALVCPSCNLHKSTRLNAVDPLTGDLTLLFHPLKQDWHLHFILRADGTCHGVSAAGRATIAALQMNDVDSVSARYLQIMLGVSSPTEQRRN